MHYHVRILAGRLDPSAGSHVYHRELARRLSARGHRVSVVCFRSDPEVAECAEIIEVPQLPWKNRRLIWRLASLLQYRHCTRELRRRRLESPDVVIAGEYLFLPAHCREFPHVPVIGFPHAMFMAREIDSYPLPPSMRWVSRQVYGRLERWALNHADCTVRFTRQACQALLDHYGRAVRPRFRVNPPGVVLGSGDKEPPGPEVRLLCLGRLVPSKGIDTALAALSKLRRHSWRLDVVGEGPLEETLRRQAREQGVNDRVHFHGQQSNPTAWYRQADLLLFPSRLESFGLVLVEAMAQGTPSLAMRADGRRYWNANAEIIEHGQTGLLANGPTDFETQLEGILREPNLLARLGRAAHRRAAERYSWDQHLDRYEQLFDFLRASPRVAVRSTTALPAMCR